MHGYTVGSTFTRLLETIVGDLVEMYIQQNASAQMVLESLNVVNGKCSSLLEPSEWPLLRLVVVCFDHLVLLIVCSSLPQ